nr:WYL domain-containing protein [Nocardia sp. BMG111209]
MDTDQTSKTNQPNGIDRPAHTNQLAGADRPAAARRVEPHHLVTRGGRWYLIGWDLDRGDWRIFRADRIGLRTPNGPRFTPRDVPGEDVAAFVTGRFRGSDTPDWPCRGEVILHLPAAAVSPFVPDGIVESLGADRCRLIAGSWSWIALAADIGRFDADFEIVGPPNYVQPQHISLIGTLPLRAADTLRHRRSRGGAARPGGRQWAGRRTGS